MTRSRSQHNKDNRRVLNSLYTDLSKPNVEVVSVKLRTIVGRSSNELLHFLFKCLPSRRRSGLAPSGRCDGEIKRRPLFLSLSGGHSTMAVGSTFSSDISCRGKRDVEVSARFPSGAGDTPPPDRVEHQGRMSDFKRARHARASPKLTHNLSRVSRYITAGTNSDCLRIQKSRMYFRNNDKKSPFSSNCLGVPKN